MLVLGGLGLFLLGMTFMTDGLKSFAGPSLRDLAARMTRTRFSAVLTGMTFTAVVQSSSATTLAAIGMVNGGLLTLEQTLGVIYGANIGTTLTAWMVSIIGFKVKTEAFALPFVGVGAMLKIFTRGRASSFGETVAGFGLLFYGISLMQAGMSSDGGFSFDTQVSSTALTGRLYLVLIGAVMTAVMQSSSAAIAITLAALSTGMVTLGDAAALAVGQNVGTTVTALIASAGASTVNAKRAAIAHLMFNIVTGALAIILFTPLLEGLVSLTRLAGIEDPPSLLSAFHTAFNVLGVALMTPFLGVTTRLLLRFVPDSREEKYAPRFLDKNVLRVPAAALDAVELELEHLKSTVLDSIESCGRKEGTPYRASKEDTRRSKARYRSTRELAGSIARFLEQVEHMPGLAERAFGFVRVIVHLRTAAAEGYKAEKDRGRTEEEIKIPAPVTEIEALVAEAIALLRKPEGSLAERDKALAELDLKAKARRKIARTDVFRGASEKRLSAAAALELAEYVNHLTRVVHELYRATHAWHTSSKDYTEGPLATEIDLQTGEPVSSFEDEETEDESSTSGD